MHLYCFYPGPPSNANNYTNPELYPSTAFLRHNPKYAMVQTAWTSLERNVAWGIRSAENIGPDPGIQVPQEKQPAWGVTRNNGPAIRITIGAEAIFPLLVPGYSKSEKLMASFLVACIILHELGVRVPPANMQLARNLGRN
jgi:hypothetical protein